MTNMEMTNKANEITMTNKRHSTKKRRVICVETGEKFVSINEASRAYNIESTYICRVCNGICNTAKGKTFRYLDNNDNIISTPEVSTTEREIIIQRKAVIRGKGKSYNGNSNAVICISTGEVFTSATDAANHADVTQGHMSNVCRGNGHSVKGKSYCYVKDINEHLDEVATSIRKANMYDEFMTKEEKRKELVGRIEYYDNMIEYNNQTVNRLLQEKQELQESREKAIRELMNFAF